MIPLVLTLTRLHILPKQLLDSMLIAQRLVKVLVYPSTQFLRVRPTYLAPPLLVISIQPLAIRLRRWLPHLHVRRVFDSGRRLRRAIVRVLPRAFVVGRTILNVLADLVQSCELVLEMLHVFLVEAECDAGVAVLIFLVLNCCCEAG